MGRVHRVHCPRPAQAPRPRACRAPAAHAPGTCRPRALPRARARPRAHARSPRLLPLARALQRPARPRPCRPAPMPPARPTRHARAPQAFLPAARALHAQHARPARLASAQPVNSQPQYNSFVLQPKTSHLSHDTIFVSSLPSQLAIPLSPCNTKPSCTLLLAIKL